MIIFDPISNVIKWILLLTGYTIIPLIPKHMIQKAQAKYLAKNDVCRQNKLIKNIKYALG